MHPTKLLPLFDAALDGYQKVLLKQVDESESDKRKAFFKAKPYCHARICHLMPNCPDTTKTMLPRASDIGTFIEVRGTIGEPHIFPLLSLTMRFYRNGNSNRSYQSAGMGTRDGVRALQRGIRNPCRSGARERLPQSHNMPFGKRYAIDRLDNLDIQTN